MNTEIIANFFTEDGSMFSHPIEEAGEHVELDGKEYTHIGTDIHHTPIVKSESDDADAPLVFGGQFTTDQRPVYVLSSLVEKE